MSAAPPPDRRRAVSRGHGLVFVGLAVQLAGIAADALIHHARPGLAAEEGPLSIANPAHLAAGVGTALILLGVARASIAAASPSAWQPFGAPVLATALVVLLAASTGAVALATGGVGGGHGQHGARGVSIGPDEVVLAELKGVLAADGIRAALDHLARMSARDKRLSRRTHAVAHELGQLAYAHYGRVGTAFRGCDRRFLSGCYHGVMQAYFERSPTLPRAGLTRFCNALSGAEGPAMLRVECQHAVGHGLLRFTKYRAIPALRHCDGMRSRWGRQQCYAGVFMEWEMRRRHPPTARRLHTVRSRPVPEFPCSSISVRYRSVCYQVQPWAILAENGGDLAAGFRTCARAPAPYEAICGRGMGEQISFQKRGDPDDAREACMLANPAQRDPCFAGVAAHYVLWEWKMDEGIAFCAGLPAGATSPCFRAVGWLVPTVRRRAEGSASECRKARRPSWIAICRRSADSRWQEELERGQPAPLHGRARLVPTGAG